MRSVEATENSKILSVLIRRRRSMIQDTETLKQLEEARGGNYCPVPEIKVQSNGHSSIAVNGDSHFSVRVDQILASRPGGVNLANLSLSLERAELFTSNVEQRRILSMVKEGQIVPEDWGNLFDWYAQSEMFKKVIESDDGNSLVSLNGNNGSKREHDFAGRVFEDIAFIYVAVKFAKHIVLSPKETLDVFKRMYPDPEIINFSPFETTIAGVSVPDGLVVDRETGKVLKILEFSLDKNADRIAGKVRTILQGRERLNKEFGGSTFLFVMPQTFPVHQSIKDNRASVSSHQLPFNRKDFGGYINYLYERNIGDRGKR